MKPKAPELFIYSCSAGSLPSGVHCAVCVMLRFCSFHEPRDERTTRTLALQCGNSMNVLCMAMIDLHSLWSWKRLRTPDLLRNIHLVRRFLSKQLDEHCRKRCLPTQEGTAYAEASSSSSPFQVQGTPPPAMFAAAPAPPVKRLKGKSDGDLVSMSFSLLKQIRKR